MRIAFLCGSQEPGRDGVGDYTRGLAEECSRQGVKCILVAINDRHVEQVETTIHSDGSEQIPSLRLPASLSWKERSEKARQFVEAFDPRWVSIQFVCYTFHPKGLVYHLRRTLGPIVAKRKLHIMFHEAWLCRELGWGGKQLIVGALQRFFIQQFIRWAKPSVMHTSNSTYAALLNRYQIPTAELPLFGAIPVAAEAGTTWIGEQLRNSLGDGFHRESIWLFGFFGTLHPQWPAEPLLTKLRTAAESVGRRPVFLSVGRTGGSGTELWNQLVRNYSTHFTFIHLGERSTKQVSEYLTCLDFGIATTQRSIIGKSSTVASMLEHGLPVIVNREDDPGPTTSIDGAEPLLLRCDQHFEHRLQTGVAKGVRASRRPAIAREFLRSLQQESTSPKAARFSASPLS